MNFISVLNIISYSLSSKKFSWRAEYNVCITNPHPNTVNHIRKTIILQAIKNNNIEFYDFAKSKRDEMIIAAIHKMQ